MHENTQSLECMHKHAILHKLTALCRWILHFLGCILHYKELQIWQMPLGKDRTIRKEPFRMQNIICGIFIHLLKTKTKVIFTWILNLKMQYSWLQTASSFLGKNHWIGCKIFYVTLLATLYKQRNIAIFNKVIAKLLLYFFHKIFHG